MKKKLLFFLALLGLGAGHFNGYAKKPAENPLLQYMDKDDNVVITSDNEEITFSIEGEKVSAKHNVKKEFNNIRFSQFYTESIRYNDEFSPLKVYNEESVTISYSSNFEEDGIFFDGMNQCKMDMNFPYLGWTCGYKYNQNYPNTIFLCNYIFYENLFLAKKVLKIEVPSWLDMEIKEFNLEGYVQKEVEKIKNGTLYTYTMTNVKKRKEEKYSPDGICYLPTLLFLYKSAQTSKGKITLFETAQNQYDWYRSLLNQNKENLDSIATQTKQITAKCKTKMEKVIAIYEWVQQNIRYIAIENSINGFKPQPAALVMDNKYGDCKGMANLLKYMLKSEGIDSRLVWLSADRRPYDYSMPSLAVDNHAICAAILGKDTLYLDGTCQYAAVGEIPISIEGRPVMIENGDKCILTHIPSNKPHDNLDSTHVSLQIVDHQLKGDFINVRRGEDKLVFLSEMDEEYDDDLEMLQSLKFVGLPKSEKDIKISDAKPKDKEVTIGYPITLPNHCFHTENEYLVSMAIKRPYNGGVIDMKERKTDVDLDYKSSTVLTAELTIPKGFKATYVPANFSIDKPNYKFEIKYTQKGNKIYCNRNIIIKERIIPLKEIDTWNKDVEALKAAYAEMVVIKK